MALPVIKYRTFTIDNKLIYKTPITMRPFTVAEEDMMIEIKDSKNSSEIHELILQIIGNCIVSPSDIDVNTLPMFGIEYIFIKLREKSIGEVIEMAFRCDGKLEDDKECNNKVKVSVNLKEIEISVDEKYCDVFYLDDDKQLGIKMKYPDTKDVAGLDVDNMSSTEQIYLCIDSIFNDSEVWKSSDTPKEEMLEFIKQIPTKVKLDIANNFMAKIPKVKTTINSTCSKCGKKHTHALEGINDFFD